MKYKLIKLLFSIVLLVCFPVAETNADLLGLWRFDETTGIVAADSWGIHNGIFVGNPQWKKTDEKRNGVIEFNVRDGLDYMEINGFKGIAGSQSRTVAAWIKTSAYGEVIGWGHSDPNLKSKGSNWVFRIQGDEGADGTIRLEVTGGYVVGETYLRDNKWHHIAAVMDDDGSPDVSEVRLYVDGKLENNTAVRAQPINTTDSGDDVKIGAFYTNGYRGATKVYLDGFVDDVAIFNHALNDEEIEKLYTEGPEYFMDMPRLRMFNDKVQKANQLTELQKHQEAIELLEKTIVEYHQWSSENPSNIGQPFRLILSEMHFQLAKAKEATGAKKEDVAKVYSETFLLAASDYSEKRVEALIWLLKNKQTDEYVKIVNGYLQNTDYDYTFKKIIVNICKELALRDDWTSFELFFETLFNRAEDTSYWALYIESCLNDAASKWTKNYVLYLESKSSLQYKKNKRLAEYYFCEKKFAEAADLYQGLLRKCNSEEEKNHMEMQLCKCLFETANYDKVVGRLEKLVVDNKSKQRVLIKDARLLMGQAYLRLGKLDEAIDCFFSLMIECPELKGISEVNFFIGYCYILQQKYEAAKQTFTCLTRSYPVSPYIEKANTLLNRIGSMAE